MPTSTIPTEMRQAVIETPALTEAPLWLREPFRLLFPIGAALGFAGVLHWLLHGLGLIEDYRPVFHAMTQIQGFLMAFAVGFLLTMIPRRTGSAPPSRLTVIIGAVAPIGVAISAWYGQWMVSQIFWLILAATLVGFAVRRFRSGTSTRRPPNSFVWIPIAFAIGVVGSILTGVGAAMGTSYWWIHDLGRSLILQGMFVALVLGVGGLAIPLMTRGGKPADADNSSSHRRARALHLLGAVLLIASFLLEYLVSLRSGLTLRAAVITVVLLWSAELHIRPNKPGALRWLIWLSAWCIPIGFMLAAVFHEDAKAFLHITFIGGLALLALSVSTQVALGHGGFSNLMNGRPWPVFLMATFAVLSIAPRVLMALDPDRFFVWMSVAAALFLAALTTWGLFVIPKLRVVGD